MSLTIREEIADLVASRRGVTARTNETDRLVADKILDSFAVLPLLPVVLDDWQDAHVPITEAGGPEGATVHVGVDGRISFTMIGNPTENADEARALAAGLVSAAAEADRYTTEERKRRRIERLRALLEGNPHE